MGTVEPSQSIFPYFRKSFMERFGYATKLSDDQIARVISHVAHGSSFEYIMIKLEYAQRCLEDDKAPWLDTLFNIDGTRKGG